MTKPDLRKFLREKKLPRTGRKAKLVKVITKALHDGTVSYTEVLGLLDAVLPWSAQHVFLLDESQRLPAPIETYRDKTTFEALLVKHSASRPLRETLPLILPEKLTVSKIEHTGDRIRVTAIERRDGFMRVEKEDKWKTDTHGRRVHMRAFIEETTRGLIVFEWNLTTNLAMLHVTRLPTGQSYDKAEIRFQHVVKKWIDLTAFPKLDLRIAVKTLHEEEMTKGVASRVRSHGIDYDTLAGGVITTRSATAAKSIMADSATKEAAEVGRKSGLGRMGNFYWKEAPNLDPNHRGIHVKVLAKPRRVHFPTGQTEEHMRHVLDEIRGAC